MQADPAAHPSETRSDSGEPTYPGEFATAPDIKKLAEEYQKAADQLLAHTRKGSHTSRAPFRLLAIHAIELYLNALLLHKQHDSKAIRGLQHNLSERAERAIDAGLQLRKRTRAHLHSLNKSREYLIVRYSPKSTYLSEVNRLNATLNEIAKKVSEEMTKKISLTAAAPPKKAKPVQRSPNHPPPAARGKAAEPQRHSP